MLESVLVFGGVAGGFAVFDALTTDAQRARIAGYVFGLPDTRFDSFAEEAIALVLLPFADDEFDELFHVPALVLTFLAMLGVMVFTALGPDRDGGWIGHAAQVVGVCFVLSGFANPVVRFSFYVSRLIFFEGWLRRWPLPLRIFADILLSSLPVLIGLGLVLIIYSLDAENGFLNAVGATVTVASAGALPALLFVSAVQVLVLTVGAVLHGLSRLTRLARRSNAPSHPFTAIGVLAGLVGALITAVGG